MAAAAKPVLKEVPIKEIQPDIRQQIETILSLRTDMLAHLLLPDLSVAEVTADKSANHVTFDVKLSPGLLSPKAGIQLIGVRVTDKVFDVDQVVFDGSVALPASGGMSRISVEFPMPADAKFTPDFTNELTIEVDPNHLVAESNETNNKITVYGTTLG